MTEQEQPGRRDRFGLDPAGRRALFDMPVTAPADAVHAGQPSDGKLALFSVAARQPGTVVVDCSGCRQRTRISLAHLGVHLATGSVWLPALRRGHWLRCPACDQRRWCGINWRA